MRAALALLALSLPAAALAAASPVFDPAPSLMAERLSSIPGVAFSHLTEQGAAITEWTKDGVMYKRTQEGSSDDIAGYDQTTHGPVTCLFLAHIMARAALRACPTRSDDGALRQEVEQDASRIGDFIVANSPLAVTGPELDVEVGRTLDEIKRLAQANPIEHHDLCAPSPEIGMVDALRQFGPERRRQAVDDALSVPRWPVLNPCL